MFFKCNLYTFTITAQILKPFIKMASNNIVQQHNGCCTTFAELTLPVDLSDCTFERYKCLSSLMWCSPWSDGARSETVRTSAG